MQSEKGTLVTFKLLFNQIKSPQYEKENKGYITVELTEIDTIKTTLRLGGGRRICNLASAVKNSYSGDKQTITDGLTKDGFKELHGKDMDVEMA